MGFNLSLPAELKDNVREMSGIWGQHQEGCDPRNAEDRATFLASHLNRAEEKFAARRLGLAGKRYAGPNVFGKGCGCPTDKEVPAQSADEQGITDQQLDANEDAGSGVASVAQVQGAHQAELESVPQSHTESAPLHLPVLAEARTADRAAREMLGPTVFNLGHELKTLCAEQGCPMDEELLHGTGEYASVRRPKASAAASIRPSAGSVKCRCTTSTRRS